MSNKFIKPLEDTDNKEIGTKLKNLKIINEKTKYFTPKTIVLTTDFYKFLIDYNKFSTPFLYKERDFKIPKKFEKEIINKIQKTFGNKPLVIRSSATCEDTKVSSFAGIFKSSFNVKGEKNILKAIISCYASLFEEKAKIYAGHHHINLDQEMMSIGVQELIGVTFSGITFTANPILRAKNEYVIEYTKSLNEKVISGKKLPKYIRVISKKQFNEETDPLILSLIKMAKVVEKTFNFPQNIEWGVKKSKFYIFQSRPITTLKNIPIRLNISHSSLREIGYGRPAVSGQCLGNLRVIKKINDYKQIKNEDILLTKEGINIKYILPFISRIAGIITTGGVLSHPIIILREFQKPCLVEPFYIDYKKYENQTIYLDAIKGKVYLYEKK